MPETANNANAMRRQFLTPMYMLMQLIDGSLVYHPIPSPLLSPVLAQPYRFLALRAILLSSGIGISLELHFTAPFSDTSRWL